MIRTGPTTAPLTPDDDTAHRWLAAELGKPEYAAARPNWFDLLAQRVVEWIGSWHFSGRGGGGGGWLAVAGIVIAAAIIAGALLRYGLPRWNRRASGARLRGDVADGRSTAQLRAAADAAAAAGDWPLAVLERFRAIAAALAERTAVTMRPGTTAHEIGVQAAAAFPAEAAALRLAADRFDAVRYLGGGASAEDDLRLRALDARLLGTAPVFAAARV